MGLGFIIAFMVIGLGAFVIVTASNLYGYLAASALILTFTILTVALLYKRGVKVYKKIVI